jgi:hypothetical protein
MPWWESAVIYQVYPSEGRAPHEALVPLNTTDLPEVHDIIAMLRRTVEEFPDRLLIGDIYLPVERLVAYYGRYLGGVHLPFNFALLNVRWDTRCIQSLIDGYEAALPKGAGRIGCSATTIGPASRAGWEIGRRPSRPCFC